MQKLVSQQWPVMVTFLPMVLASLGGFHTVASRDVKKLATALVRHTAEEEKGYLQELTPNYLE